MLDRPALGQMFAAFTVLGGVAAIAYILSQPLAFDWVEFLLLAAVGCAASQLKIRLPGAERSVTLAILPVFAAIAHQSLFVAFLVAAVTIVFDHLVGRGSHVQSSLDLAVDLAVTAVAVLCASATHDFFTRNVGLGWLLGLAFAALVYYLVYSGVSAVRMGLTRRASPWLTWKSNHFWTLPVYLLAPAGVGAVEQLLGSSTLVEKISGAFLASFVILYLKIYLARLHDREHDARDKDLTQRRAIEALAMAIDAKDGSSPGHLRRVKQHAALLARKIGCSETEIQSLELAAILHDVGKVGVPDYILNKPSRLTQHEFNEIAQHSILGAEIVSQVQFPAPVEEIVLSHHERWDGNGYPRGLKGGQIPRMARVLTVADIFNTLLNDRPYRDAMTIEQAVDSLREERGKIFDPEIVDVFLQMIPGLREELCRDLESERNHAERRARPLDTVQQSWVTDEVDEQTSLRRQTLQQLMSSPDQLLAFYEILHNLGADLNFDKSIEKCLQILVKTIPFDKAGIFVLESDQFLLLQGSGFPEHCISRLALAARYGLVAQVAQTKLAIVANAPPSEVADGRVPRFLDDVRSTLMAPLVVDDQVIGVIALCSLQPAAFTAEQANFLSLVTPKLASTVASSRALQQLYLEAETDEMTNLPNSRAAFRKLDAELKRAERQGQTVAVLFMDLDGLKPVNDSYGHAAGDRLLLEIGRKLRAYLRSYDFVGRVGGDEFLAIVPGIEQEGLEGKVQALKKAVASHPVMVSDGIYLRPAISIGAAIYPHDGTDTEELIYLSDRRMYQDKLHTHPGANVPDVATHAS